MMIGVGDQVRMTWVALDPKSPPDKQYRIVFVVDFSPAQLGGLAGSADTKKAPGSAGG
jgi:hypothetical protein